MMASHTTLEVKFLKLLEARQIPQTLRPKIQKVPQYLRNKNIFDKHYSPKSVSIGLIHYDNQNLKLGENYKLTLAAKYIRNTHHTPESLHQKIADHIDELKGLFAEDVLALASTAESLKGFRSLEEKLSWLLFVDGCFLLYILDVKVNSVFDDQEDMNNIKFDQLFYLVMMDVLLLENQLPFLVLKLLWKNDNQNELIYTMMNFLTYYHWTIGHSQMKLLNVSEQPPAHLLDLQRKLILLYSKPKTKEESVRYSKSKEHIWLTVRNIEDLTAGGVNLKPSWSTRPTDIEFSEGWFSAELTLPEIYVDDKSASSFVNLIAYEMCPDFKNDYGIISFVVFIDTLIDHARDVKILRSQGILVNALGRDEDVADFFSIISTDLIFNPDTYVEVIAKIHYNHFNKGHIWFAQGYRTYFSNPWSIIGFLAAFIALALTFVQAWFSIFPR
ncbi:unnamed protein product [Vicia faba]|uniref:Uncharacterized protein n=1 Tax=Vicia faba TaxID=3906 RepID=A0AAV0YLV6_VICFA|nr:unnamed protein product [Vicia faba]